MAQHNSFQVARLSSDRVQALLAIGNRAKSSKDGSASSRVEPLICTLVGASKSEIQQLVSDLKQPVISSEDGLLSFQRLTGIGDKEAAALVGKSFLRALTSPRTTLIAMECLAQYGQILISKRMPQSNRVAGRVIQLLATAAIASQGKQLLTDSERVEITRLLKIMHKSSAFPKSVRDYDVEDNRHATNQ